MKGLRKTRKIAAMIIGVQAEIRTISLPNTSQNICSLNHLALSISLTGESKKKIRIYVKK
jgi:hypothetical protein